MSVLVALAPTWDGPRERSYSAPEMLAQVNGMTYRQLDYWTRTGALRCDDANPGSGNHRVWPQSEIPVARALSHLANLDRRNGRYRSILRTATHAIRRGETVFELIPGVTVDIRRLGDAA